MKQKIAMVLISIFMISIAATAQASEKLTYKGDYFFRGRMELNRQNKEDDTDDRTYYHQRIRTHFFYQVMEEITIEMRADWNEGAWGHNVDRAATPDTTKDYKRAIQIERANAKFTKPQFDAVIGLQQSGRQNAFGLDYVYKPQASGLSVQLRLPLTIDASYYKYSEGASEDVEADLLTDETSLGGGDIDLYGGQVSYKSESLQWGVNYAAKNDRQTDDNPQVVSLWGNVEFGSAAVGIEGDYFFGDNGGGTDYVGNQLYLDAAVGLNETIRIGAHGFYQMGTDEADEQVLGAIEIWGPWVPSISFGMPGFTWDGIEGLAGVHNFNLMGDNGGQIGGDVYININIGDVEIGVQSYYFVPEDDSVSEKTSEFGICGGVAYTYKKKAVFALGVLYSTPEYDDDRDIEASIGAQSAVRIKF